MNDVVIFVVGLEVTVVAMPSAFADLIANDHPNDPKR